MEDRANLFEEIVENAVEYGKSSLELAKLRVLDKTMDVVSSFMANSVVVVIMFVFMLFLNLGFALWIGKILGEIYFGFFVVAGFYCVLAILVYFFLLKWIKKLVGNAIIKQVLN